jgi:4-alpha-glucanotransferase
MVLRLLLLVVPRRRHDVMWRSQALRTLPALMAASDMLICGEDLGFVPACLPPVMQVGRPPT